MEKNIAEQIANMETKHQKQIENKEIEHNRKLLQSESASKQERQKELGVLQQKLSTLQDELGNTKLSVAVSENKIKSQAETIDKYVSRI